MFETATYVLTEYGDPRTKHWVLASFKELVFMEALYLWIVLYAGPKFMKNRPAFELKKVILGYNVFQVLFSVFLVYQAYRGGWFNGYSFVCAPLDRSNEPNIMNATFWWYLLAKYTEFFDTLVRTFVCKYGKQSKIKNSKCVALLQQTNLKVLPRKLLKSKKPYGRIIPVMITLVFSMNKQFQHIFFVLRKRTRQVSPLHIFHHVTVPIVSWIGVRYFPNGHGTAYLFLNSLVHIVMYSYYFLTCLDPYNPTYQKIKKHITQMQMVQFTLLMLHNVVGFYRECDFPKGVNILVFSEAGILMVLFSKFYYASYCRPKKAKTDENRNQRNLTN